MSVSVGYKGLEHADKDMIFYVKENEISDVTLHGYPVKVGDMVWDYEIGYGEVFRLIEKELFCVCFGGLDYCFYSSNGEFVRSEHSHGLGFVRLFWQPINPAAIESAKVKP